MTQRPLSASQTDPGFIAAVPTMESSHVRKHSLRMVAAVQSWAASLSVQESDEVRSLYATWCELLRALAGEASFLGSRVLQDSVESCTLPLKVRSRAGCR